MDTEQEAASSRGVPRPAGDRLTPIEVSVLRQLLTEIGRQEAYRNGFGRKIRAWAATEIAKRYAGRSAEDRVWIAGQYEAAYRRLVDRERVLVLPLGAMRLPRRSPRPSAGENSSR